MFIGHYGVSYAAKRIAPALPLWALFLAVQLVDVFWAIFVLLGIEHVRIVPGITATNPLDLYYMPYTHGLLSSLAWAVAAYFAWRFLRRGQGSRAALVLAAAVFSHWVLDFLVHRPDLPLWGDSAKVGLGLWDYPIVAFLLEVGLFFGGMAWYLRATRPAAGARGWEMIALGLAMVALHTMVFFGAPPTSAGMAAGMGLGGYLVLAAAAAWLERRRVPQET